MLRSTTPSRLQGNNFHNKTTVVSYGGVKTNELSSNDIQQVGATVQQDLYSTLLYFRTHKVHFTADIATIYCQVSELQQDRDLQGIQ